MATEKKETTPPAQVRREITGVRKNTDKGKKGDIAVKFVLESGGAKREYTVFYPTFEAIYAAMPEDMKSMNLVKNAERAWANREIGKPVLTKPAVAKGGRGGGVDPTTDDPNDVPRK